jgi:phenol 2-monooxygenase (NADPH)
MGTMTSKYTPRDGDIDSVFQHILVFSSKRHDVEVYHIPELFKPTTGKWRMQCKSGTDMNVDRNHRWVLTGYVSLAFHKIFADDESWNSGHGHAYEAYGINAAQGCLVVVRPDHCQSQHPSSSSSSLFICLFVS